MKVSLFSRPLLLAATVLVGGAVPAMAATISSTFDTDAEGWTTGDDTSTAAPVFDGTIPNHFNSGGNPGGYIQTADTHGNNVFLAPSGYLGNQSALHGGTMTFSINNALSSDFIPSTTVVLYSTAGAAIVYQTSINPTGAWTDFTVPLSGATGWRLYAGNQVSGGAAINDATFQNYLANITALAILADWHNGSDDVGLDSVALNAAPVTSAPIPAALPLFASCIGALGFFGWQRKRKSAA